MSDGGDRADLLATASLRDPQISAYPNAYYAAMRLGDPVHQDPQLGSWLVSRYEDLQTVFADPVTFAAGHGFRMLYARGFIDEFRAIMERDGGGFVNDAVPSDPPYHSRIRKLMEQAFTAHRVKALEPTITAMVAERVEALADRGHCDAVKEFAQPMTIQVICEELGFDQVDGHKVERWSHAVMQQVSAMQTRETMLENTRQMAELQLFLRARLAEREGAPREDMTSDLVHAVTEDGSRLTTEEALSVTRALMIAGNETTATALANLFFLLATDPEQAAQLRAVADDDRALARWVEEFLRLYPPLRCISRGTTREVELGGKTIPADSHMLLLFASGNFDESEFSCPHAFDANRPNLGRQISFGAGSHRCVGISLARMEIKVAAREIIRRLDNFRLEIPIEEIGFVPTISTRSMVSLPMSFTRRI
jgi:cytochrome P450